MFRKIIMILCSVLILAGCSKKEDSRTTLVVGFDADFPPYGYMENGEAKGFDLDLAREVCRRNGWKCIPRAIAWDQKDAELNSGNIDCIWNGFSITGRENDYEWSAPYTTSCQVVTVLKKSPIWKLKDLKDKVVAVQMETPIYMELAPAGKLEELGKSFRVFVACKNFAEAFRKLDNGTVDAVISDIGVAGKQIAGHPGKYIFLRETLLPDQIGIGFKRGNRELCAQVEKTLREMAADGTASRISAQYFDGRNTVILQP